MFRSFKIALMTDDKETRSMYGVTLSAMGHEVVGDVGNGRDLVSLCAKLQPALVIADIKAPEMDDIELADLTCKTEPVPIMYLSEHYDEKIAQHAQLNHVLAYLLKPLKARELEMTIIITMSRFGEFKRARAEAASLKQALQDRKLIERAKGILMLRSELPEHEAFRRLQRLSWERNEKLVKVAEALVLAEAALVPVSGSRDRQNRCTTQ